MKTLFFCDIHGDYKALDKLIKKAESLGVDVLVCAGDLSNFGEELEKLVKRLDIGLPLYMIPGNHETEEEIKELDSKFDFFHNLHLKAKKINDSLLVGCGGGGLSPYHTPFEKSEKYFEKELKKFKDLKKSTLVTHAPPADTELDSIKGEHVGVKSIRKFIEKEQPGLAVCGHLHENSGKSTKIGETKIVNPGKKGVIA